VEVIVGCGDITGERRGSLMRKAQILYKNHLNQALRHIVARMTIAEGARHVSKKEPVSAMTMRKDTTNENKVYGTKRIIAARKASDALKEGAGSEVGSIACMIVISVTTF